MIMTKQDCTIEAFYIENREFLRKNESGYISWFGDDKMGFVVYANNSTVFNELEELYSVLIFGKKSIKENAYYLSLSALSAELDVKYHTVKNAKRKLYDDCKEKVSTQQYEKIKKYIVQNQMIKAARDLMWKT